MTNKIKNCYDFLPMTLGSTPPAEEVTFTSLRMLSMRRAMCNFDAETKRDEDKLSEIASCAACASMA